MGCEDMCTPRGRTAYWYGSIRESLEELYGAIQKQRETADDPVESAQLLQMMIDIEDFECNLEGWNVCLICEEGR